MGPRVALRLPEDDEPRGWWTRGFWVLQWLPTGTVLGVLQIRREGRSWQAGDVQRHL